MAAAENQSPGPIEARCKRAPVDVSESAAIGRPTSIDDEAGACCDRSAAPDRELQAERKRQRRAAEERDPHRPARIVTTWPSAPEARARSPPQPPRGHPRRARGPASSPCRSLQPRPQRRRRARGRAPTRRLRVDASGPERERRQDHRRRQVNPSQAASPPSLPARWTPIAIPSWLEDGPGRRFGAQRARRIASRPASRGAT